ncbi:unnamed protein product [Closterium sp. Yama58-4]|nr:unnamed protein product [Closterium sp. Yama58-4]
MIVSRQRSHQDLRDCCAGTVALLALIAALSATCPASAQYLFPAIPAPPPPNTSDAASATAASAAPFPNGQHNNGADNNEDALPVVTIAGPRLWEVPGRQPEKTASLSAATSAATTAATSATGSSGSTRRPSGEELYIVYFRNVPSVIDYKGGIPGFAATAAPATDDGLTASAATAATDDDDGGDVESLEAGYDSDATGAPYATGGAAGGGGSYRYVLNGVSVKLTRSEAHRLQRHESVLKVERSRTVSVQTIHTPQFLQLPSRVWPSVGGRSRAGNGMIIGIVDTGIWPEHPSFSDKGYSPVPPRWRGTCMTTSDFKGCSRKIIGARYFAEGLVASGGAVDPSTEYLSPRDASDHGTWCAGAAAGNPVKVSGGGVQFGTASGMAPRARIAVYKAIWVQGKLAVGSDSDVFAAVDRAVADGVDVLSSMSVAINEETYFKHLAMLRAARAGVFVALVAGNSGPPPGTPKLYRTLTNLSPYYITVAASTSSQAWPPQARLALGNRQSYLGETLLGGSTATRQLPLVDAKTAAAAGYTASQAEACMPTATRQLTLVGAKTAAAAGCTASQAEACVAYSLSPSKVRGNIVVCCTGFSYASEKAAEVARVGGRAIIVVPYANGEGAVKAVALGLPGLFLVYWKGKAIREYIRSTPNPIATLSALFLPKQVAPQMAVFSGAGPAVNPAAGFYDSSKITNAILKPDITAPGVSLLGPMAAGSTSEGSFRALSGTSMAAPHIAGIAALLMQKYPTWSPAAIKSAMLTTAYTTNTARKFIRTAKGQMASPWNYGSGHVFPAKALDPGLVYDVGMMGYLSFLTGVDRAQAKAAFPQWNVAPIQPFNLNQPNICVPKLKSTVTVYRSVTNVSGKQSRYSATVVAPKNVAVTVRPTSFVIGPSKSQAFTVTLRPTAATNAFSFGSLTWTDGVHSVRSVALHPSLGEAAQLGLSGSSRQAEQQSNGAAGERSSRQAEQQASGAADKRSSRQAEQQTSGAADKRSSRQAEQQERLFSVMDPSSRKSTPVETPAQAAASAATSMAASAVSASASETSAVSTAAVSSAHGTIEEPPHSRTASPCAACKFLRRKCTAECVFAPYFPPDQPGRFANVHRVFGASNVTRILAELPPELRGDAANSMAYEAEARVQDPVYGCVSAISLLQQHVIHLQTELLVAQQELSGLQRALEASAQAAQAQAAQAQAVQTQAAQAQAQAQAQALHLSAAAVPAPAQTPVQAATANSPSESGMTQGPPAYPPTHTTATNSLSFHADPAVPTVPTALSAPAAPADVSSALCAPAPPAGIPTAAAAAPPAACASQAAAAAAAAAATAPDASVPPSFESQTPQPTGTAVVASLQVAPVSALQPAPVPVL